VDALALVAGGRASSQSVRPECERAEVSAVFESGGSAALKETLKSLEIEDPEGQCVLRRIVGADGRSRAFVNGVPVAVGTLKRLGELLIDIHGQHAHHALLRREEQLRMLDEYASHPELLKAVAGAHSAYAKLCREIEAEMETGEDPAARLDYLRFQLAELEALNITPQSLAEINEEHSRLAHVSELQSAAEEALVALDNDQENSARSQLAVALRALSRIESFDGSVSGARALLYEASINLDEAQGQLEDYREGLNADPERLEKLDRRLARIHDAARKHRVEIEMLPDLLQRLSAESERLATRGERLEALKLQREALFEQYRSSARRLSESRNAAADRLSSQVIKNLRRLGMEGASFKIEVTPDETRAPSKTGTDRVEFYVAPNPGLPMNPVSQTASGGELSRISLAIQVVDVSSTGVPVVVFDEVDVGVGGGHAEVVGNMLRSLARHRQVLCVTHLPQVASRANHHLRVLKDVKAGTTTTRVEYLQGEQRVDEVARMLGGLKVTRKTVAHAREMIERA
ncbi:MAG: DNA repair protein RecN, partial [Gammaproteobacteria bacterium]|nr:DNA repair protein RecN [Gammaproteobacteria bacterium]